jgi:hypothetical protein
MAGFYNGILFATNADFTGEYPPVGQIVLDGQIFIGSTVAPFIRAGFLTSSDGSVIITAGHGTINLKASSPGIFPWTDKSANFNADSNNGYFVTGTCVGTLPVSPAQGDSIEFAIDSSSAILTIQANTGQIIRIGTAVCASAGICVSNKNGDSLSLVFRNSDDAWISVGAPEGVWTLT